MGKKAFVMFKLPGDSKVVIARDKIVEVYRHSLDTCLLFTVNDGLEGMGTEVQGSLEEILELLEGED